MALIALAVSLWSARDASAQGDHALVLTFDGPLTPAMLMYLERGLAQAEQENAALVILKLNTPGGQIDLMEKMVSAIRNNDVPVVVYVAPRGAIAGSAGTLITLAGHVAAMAPETAIGAASPVGGEGEDLGQTMEAKTKEAMTALVRTLAERRSPEAIELAEATVLEAKAATATEALAVGLVDLIADDVPTLLQQLDGFSVVVNGQPRELLTRGLLLTEVSMSLIEQLLNVLTNPNVVFLLMSLGTLLIIIEVQTPGGWIAGFTGAVCLVFAFYGLGVLPVNWFGAIFIVLAVGLFVAEIFTPATFGALTATGAISLVVGALVLFNSPGSPEFFQVNVPLVIITALLFAGASLGLLTVGLRSTWRLPVHSPQSLVGQTGDVRSAESAQVGGELWSIEPESGSLAAGDKVEVIAVEGLRLRVRKK